MDFLFNLPSLFIIYSIFVWLVITFVTNFFDGVMGLQQMHVEPLKLKIIWSNIAIFAVMLGGLVWIS